MVPVNVALTLVLVAISLLSVHSDIGNQKSLHRRQRRDIHEEKTLRNAEASLDNCASTEKTQLHHLGRYPRKAPESYSFGKATYFAGKGEVLRLKLPDDRDLDHDLPREGFTIEAWLKPEGGQKNHTMIIGLVDTCSMTVSDKGWSIGIHSLEEDAERDARIYFSLRTDRARESTTISSHLRYEPNRWIHVAATYDGRKMKLFINGAKVAVSHRQHGDLFSRTTSQCKELDIGGNVFTGNFYRGLIDEVLLWSEAREHSEIKNSMHSLSRRKENHSKLDHYEDFSNVESWEMILDNEPEIVQSDMPAELHDVHVVTPKCGMTVCDNPDVARSYANYWTFRKPKTVRYQVINVYDDDGTNPTVTDDQINYQHRQLNVAFNVYNITWQLSVRNISDSLLRSRTILFGCGSDKIGNGRCNHECRHERTGDDGGDCDVIKYTCEKSKIGDGHCDEECNRGYHGWDGGDCCLPNSAKISTNCYDPKSPHRTYMDVNEYKTYLSINGSNLNVYFAHWTNPNLQGIATFPWEKEVFGTLGGVILQPESYGKPGNDASTIHEFGHILGLWHIHHGVSEMECTSECLEIVPSFECGDLVADTKPTPFNQHCRDPDPTEYDTCGLQQEFKDTPYDNYMSYADDDCTDHFTPQQVSRMHCYLDLMYKPWEEIKTPSPVPLPPKIISVHDNSVNLAWVPSLSGNFGGPHSDCSNCNNDNTLEQYAYTAFSPNPSRQLGLWDPTQALGPPDAEYCDASTKAWLPDPLNTICDDCYIELGFKIPVVPIALSLWVAWNPSEGKTELKLIYTDNMEESLGTINAYCDMPYTMRLNVYKKVKAVRVHISSPYTSIDAVQIVSDHSHPVCQPCKPIKYVLHRMPPFETGVNVITVDSPKYIDSGMMDGVEYTYQIQAIQGSKISELSPPLTHRHGQPFCGDGLVDSAAEEECDDGNAIDGDGCGLGCKKDEFFNCQGEPSLCYHYDGDGVCEEFERHSSVRDCGFYTPSGYTDQWASTAYANPSYQSDECPESIVIGQPLVTQKCESELDSSMAWKPCNPSLYKDDFWLRVGFENAVIATSVILYLASDGINRFSREPKAIAVDLIDTNGRSHPLTTKSIVIYCRDNPIHLNVIHDLSLPFYKSQGVLIRFKSPHVAVSAVALRSNDGLDLSTLGDQCTAGEMYNPFMKKCVTYQCKTPVCDRLNVKHAQLECTDFDKEFNDGDICRITCDDGYVLSMEREVMCVNGEWTGASSLACVAIDCQMPVISNAEVVCPDGTTLGKQCTFKCNPPAKMHGNDNAVICQADGMYSLPEAFCQVVCDVPTTPPNAVLRVGGMKKCLSGGHYVGSSCKFRCKVGYHVNGYPIRRRTLRYTCEEDAEWHGPTCKQITCERPPAEFTGMYNCTDGFNYDSECKLHCPGDTGEIDKSNTIKCDRDGTWIGNFKMCKSVFGECPTPPSSKAVEFKCKSTSIADTCVVSCKQLRFDPVVMATNEGTNELVNVDEITCTGLKRWYPNPSDIACEEVCSDTFLGDGWCDQKTNRAYCQWDGGDCCESTLGSEVKPFPEDCTTKCQCLDPNTIENKGNWEDSKKRVNFT
ncbi:pappalysin-1-like [Glandiceps talaboti]